jgi:EAL domain-containing protein (putative c-di-GMP-specific phosphodiesterase class I)/GGDEF domain-containing protein
VTKLYNRRYFMGELSGYLQSETLSSGSILFLSFNDILVAKQAVGFAKLDELLKGFADLLGREGGQWNDTLIARLGGQDFVMLAPNASAEALRENAGVIMEKSRGMINSYGIDASAFCLNGAVSAYSGEDTIKNLLSRTDFALTAAKAKGAFSVEMYKETGSATSLMGKEEWAQEIQTAMETGRIRLAMQSVLEGEGTIYHDEVYLRFEDREGEIHSAGYFMPMLIRLGLTNEVDKHVFTQVMRHIGENPDVSLAVNVSTDFIKDGAMLYWLTQQLKENKNPISFEVSNGQVLRDLAVCNDFAAMVRSYGNRFGIDNFSTQSGDMNYLKELKPSYIKMHKNMLLEDSDSEESKAVFKSLQIIAESLGILFIAVAVESAEERDKLAAMGIDAMQGSGISPISMMERANG